jgi:hypothetical protein
VSAPAYHLRPNKAVDRLIFMDAIGHLERLHTLDTYTYYGFGGPYLEDFRLLYERYPTIDAVSIERDSEVLKRQDFHRPCGTLRLEETELKSFIVKYDPRDRRSIFWLDYTNLRYSNFEEFSALIGKLAADSLVKITLRGQLQDFLNKQEQFREYFSALMPDPSANPPVSQEAYASLIQKMLQIAAQRALPAATGMTFQPICTFYYSDGTFMFTATGIVCARSEKSAIRDKFRPWRFASLNWARPKRIDVPTLTTKERLHLQNLLPCARDAGSVLRRRLGYLIDDGRAKSESRLKQYELFHRYYPYVMRGVP